MAHSCAVHVENYNRGSWKRHFDELRGFFAKCRDGMGLFGFAFEDRFAQVCVVENCTVDGGIGEVGST